MTRRADEASDGSWPIRLVHPSPTTSPDRAAPAVLVAAWLLADLADFPAVLIDQVGSSEIHLRPVGDASERGATAVRRRVDVLLADDRLAGWTTADLSDTTPTLLEQDGRNVVRKADSS